VGGDEYAVPEVEDFLGVEPDVGEGFEQLSPELMESVMAVVDGVRVAKSHLPRVILVAARVIASEGHVEVASIRRCVSLPRETHKDRSAQPRVARQSHPRGDEPGKKRREADQDSFLQSPVLPCVPCGRESNTSHGFGVLLRHRQRSIPQGQGLA
jgi:hypothetical protein